MEAEKKCIRLDEVTLMRCILALLIVFMHAFTCFQGGWRQPDGYVDISVYKWIARASFAFTLEAFVFISGYLFAFQRLTLNRTRGGHFISHKIKRLIIPSIIFSALYFLFFCEYIGISNLLYNLVNGCGHMWFLPMLFWCFIGGLLLELMKIGDIWKLFFLVCLNIFWPLSLPLQISVALHYLAYFYGGYLIYKHSPRIKVSITPSRIFFVWLVFIIVFIVFRPLKETIVIGVESSFVFRFLSSAARNICQLIYASIGTIAFYITAVWYTNRHQLKPFTIKLASCCFGIYLFQQFILYSLYYKTGFPSIVGPYCLPWLGFLIATSMSYVLADVLLKTKVGKYLIG